MRISHLFCSCFVAQSVIAATITKFPLAKVNLDDQNTSINRLLPRGDNSRQQQSRKKSPGRQNLSQPVSEKSINSRPATGTGGRGQRGRRLGNQGNQGNQGHWIAPGSQHSSGQLQQQNRYGPRPRTRSGQSTFQAPPTAGRQASPGLPNSPEHLRLYNLLTTAQARRPQVAQATNPVAQNTDPIFNPFSQQSQHWHAPNYSAMLSADRSPPLSMFTPSPNRSPFIRPARPRFIDDLLRTAPAQAVASVGPVGRLRVNNHPTLHPDLSYTTAIRMDPGRHGARQRVAGEHAAHAGADSHEQYGFATSKARGSKVVSTYMSTGPNGHGCINCHLPGQHPVKIDVGPGTSNVRVQAENAHSWMGPAEIVAEVVGQGTTVSNAYNYRLRRRAEIGQRPSVEM